MQVKVLIRKVRNKAAGTIGEQVLHQSHRGLSRVIAYLVSGFMLAQAEPDTEGCSCICRRLHSGIRSSNRQVL